MNQASNHRVVVSRRGGPDVLRLVEEDLPEPRAGEVRVKMLAAGVSAYDLMVRSDSFPGFPRVPFTPGVDIVGVVDQLGPGVSTRDDVSEAAEHHEIWLIDKEGANLNLDFILTDTAEGIAAAREEGKKVFIHCVQGESRTPAVAAAYLAHRLGISAEDAVGRVRKVLPRGNPKPWFREALRRLWPGKR